MQNTHHTTIKGGYGAEIFEQVLDNEAWRHIGHSDILCHVVEVLGGREAVLIALRSRV
jgi:hypothetical protein